MNSGSLTNLVNAGVQCDGRWLVRGVNLTIKQSEIVTLIGPNGSGKSTTAKMVLGILNPDEGTAGRNDRIQIGYVPQKISVDWTLPLNVERFIRLTGRVTDKQITNVLEITEVPHLRNVEIRKLSGGEFQRVMLARAIAREPNLLILDEPAQGVDLSGEMAIYDLIKNIRDDAGCGILLISHDLHLVMAATDWVVCLNGHVCCSGLPSDVASSSAFQELFGSEVKSKLAIYEHSHDHTHLPDGRVRHADGSITDYCHPNDGHHHVGERLVRSDV